MRRRTLLGGALLALVIAGCGGGGKTASTSTADDFAAGGANVVAVTLDSGPDGQGTINTLYTSVTLCQSGTSICVTVPDVQVDTGSSGLRILASALSGGGVTLTPMSDASDGSRSIGECLAFASSYLWGPVATADVTLGGESASAIPVQIIDDSGGFTPAPEACSSEGTSLNSQGNLGANGVLGVGLFDKDCDAYCATVAANNFYFSCSASGCSQTTLALASQVSNPVASFATDNNGVILQLPGITSAGAATASGYLVFGIGTETNNALASSARVLTTNAEGFFTTTFNGQSLDQSFIDSGSNGYFFPDSALPGCAEATDFYCPATLTSLSASNEGQNGTTISTSFQVANLDALDYAYYAFDDVGGTSGDFSNFTSSTGIFDWGVPFFFGRTVFTAIEGRTAGRATGPYFAY